MKIAIACDHGAFDLKQKVAAHLGAKGYEVVDFGTHSKDSCDYPDFAGPAAQAVAPVPAKRASCCAPPASVYPLPPTR